MTTVDSSRGQAIDPVVMSGLHDAARTRLSGAAEDAELDSTARAEVVESVIATVIGDYVAAELMRAGRVVTAAEEAKLTAGLKARLSELEGIFALLADDTVEDIWVNGCDQVFTRHADGVTTTHSPVAETDAELVEAVRSLAAAGGAAEQERRFDRASPILDLQLDHGVRLHAIMSVTPRPCVSIRRHRLMKTTLEELTRMGTCSADAASVLSAAVAARMNLIIAGQTGAGKTTLLRALACLIGPKERLVTIEDSFELALDADGVRHPDTVALQQRLPNIEGEGGIDMRSLFRAGLRMNPSRVVVGEVRGDEVVPMLHAMSQGNNGSLSTIHASSSAGVFNKLALFAAASPERLDESAMARLIAETVDLVIHMTLDTDGNRVISSIREVTGADGAAVVSNELYRPDATGRATFACSPSQARSIRLASYGYHIPSGSAR